MLFNFSGTDVRCYLEEDVAILFLLKDLADVFEQDTHRLTRRLDDDDRRQVAVIDSRGRSQEMIGVSEAGWYDSSRASEGLRSVAVVSINLVYLESCACFCTVRGGTANAGCVGVLPRVSLGPLRL